MRLRGKKKLLASALARSGALRLARSVAGAGGAKIVVLAYHRVLPGIDAAFSGDEELVSALLEDFRWQMAYVARHCNALSLEQFLNAIRGEAQVPPRAVLVSFDDGCVDSIRHAVPALVDAGVPAVFFVASGYMGARELYWFDDVVHRIVRTPHARLDLDALELSIDLPSGIAPRKEAAARVVRQLKHTPGPRLLGALDEIRRACAIVLPDELIEQHRPMTWAELKTIASQGMHIGSHSVTHPVLAGLDDAQLVRELEQSKLRIERELDVPCHAIAYPLGGDAGYSVSGAIAVDERVRGFAARAGYFAGFTYIPGIVRLGEDDPLLLHRVPVERYLTRDEFAARLTLPDIFV